MTPSPDTGHKSLLVIYDGDCGICNALRLWAERRDSAGHLQFVPNQTADLDALAPGLTQAETERAVIAVRADGRRYRGARAVFELLRRVPGFWGIVGRIGALPPLSLLAEPAYRIVAHHRARISRWLGLTECRIPESKPRA